MCNCFSRIASSAADLLRSHSQRHHMGKPAPNPNSDATLIGLDAVPNPNPNPVVTLGPVPSSMESPNPKPNPSTVPNPDLNSKERPDPTVNPNAKPNPRPAPNPDPSPNPSPSRAPLPNPSSIENLEANLRESPNPNPNPYPSISHTPATDPNLNGIENPGSNSRDSANPGPIPNPNVDLDPISCSSSITWKKLCMSGPRSRSSGSSILDVFNDHILTRILKNLDHFDRKSWRLCCKQFYALESSCRTRISLLRAHILPSMWPFHTCLQHLDLSSCTFLSDENLHSMVAMTTRTRLMSLSLAKVETFTNLGLISLAKECRSIVEIDLSRCYQLSDLGVVSLAHMKSLKSLKLGGCRFVTDAGIIAVTAACQKLEVLNLRGCTGITDASFKAMAFHARELRELDLSHTKITKEGLSAIAELNLLEKLTLIGCNHVDDDGLINLKRGCKSLQMLDISRCEAVNHAGLIGLAYGAVSLKHIVLSYCDVLTDEVLQNFGKFSDLRSLRLDGCELTDIDLGLVGKSFKNLKELSLSKCKGVTDMGISAAVMGCIHLNSIDLTCCGEVTDVGLSAITISCKDLITLKMESCSQVSREGFLKLSSCQYLEELDLTDTNLNDEGLMAATKCRTLRILKIGYCASVLDEGLYHVASNCPNLRELDIYRSGGVGNRGMSAICSGCKELRSLNISYCSNVTDNGLLEVARLQNLSILEMRGCTAVTSLGLIAVAKACHRLVELDVKHCRSLEDFVPLELALHCNNLKQINLSYCAATDEGIVALARRDCMQNMRLVHVENLSLKGVYEVLIVGESLLKLKLLVEFKYDLPDHIIEHAEKRGCHLRWMDKD